MLADGDPKIAAPALYQSMNRAERWQIDNAYGARVLFAGKGDPRYPDDQPAADIAKRAFRRGIIIWHFAVSVPFMLICAGAYSFLQDGDFNLASVGVATLSGLSVGTVWGLALLRIRRINDYFAQSPLP